MTDGGDGARSEDAETSVTPPDDPAESARTDGSLARNGHRLLVNNGDEGPVTLAEPTRSRLATEQAQSPELDRGPITEYTTDRRSLAGAVRVQWATRATVLAVVLGLLLTAVLRGLSVSPVYGLAALGAFVGLSLLWVVASYRIWVYQVREDSLYLERGVLTHVRTVVPYVRIQHVDTSRSALERGLGLSTLVVYTAGSRGADVSVPGLTPEEASDLQQRLKELAIEADGDDAL